MVDDQKEPLQINVVIAFATLSTILPLLGIFVVPNLWWGILIKLFLGLVIIGFILSYFRDLMWRETLLGPGIVLNMIWFAGMWFVPVRWIVTVFGILFVTGLITIRVVLKEHYSDVGWFSEKLKKEPWELIMISVEQKNKKFQEIEEKYEEDIEMINNVKAEWLTTRGNNYGNRKKYIEAVQDFEEAIEFKSDYLPAYFGLATVYKERGQMEKGLETINSAPDEMRLFGKVISSKEEAMREMMEM